MNPPLISFITPSYNHEKYIDSFIASLQNQSITDWELIIIDDNSTDNNCKKIKNYTDSRINLIENSSNQGITSGLNKAITLAKSQILSFMASDDELKSNYIEKILNKFENDEISAVYTELEYMDEKGNKLNKSFLLPKKNINEIFIKSFLDTNQLPSPGMAFRKSAIEKFLPLDNSLMQFSDSLLHIYLLFNNKISLLNLPLVKYRISQNSASAVSSAVILREELETNSFMNSVAALFENNREAFMNYFGDNELIQEEIAKNKEIKESDISFWIAQIVLSSPIIAKKKWAMQKIMSCINTENKLNELYKNHAFDYKSYIELTKKVGTQTDIEKKYKQKFKKYRKRIKTTIYCIIAFLFIYFLSFYYSTNI